MFRPISAALLALPKSQCARASLATVAGSDLNVSQIESEPETQKISSPWTTGDKLLATGLVLFFGTGAVGWINTFSRMD